MSASKNERWASVAALPAGACYANALSTPQDVPMPIQRSLKIPTPWTVPEDTMDFEVTRRRLAQNIRDQRSYRNQYPLRVERVISQIFNEFNDDQFIDFCYNSLTEVYKEWLDEEEIDWEADLVPSSTSGTSETDLPGSYTVTIGGETGQRSIVQARYAGGAWGFGGLLFRQLQRQNHDFRMRALEKSRNKFYAYVEGVHGPGMKRMRFVAYATFQWGDLTSEEIKGWACILETQNMVLTKTFDESERGQDVPLFTAMYLSDMGVSPLRGTNRTPSIRQSNAGSVPDSNEGRDKAPDIVKGLIAAWKRQGGGYCSRVKARLEILPPLAQPRNNPVVKIEAFYLGLPRDILAANGYQHFDTIVVTIDLVEDGVHPHAWIKVSEHYPEADQAMRLGICISGINKDPHSPNQGTSFSHWVKRQRNEDRRGIEGNPAVNAAMSIIDWLRGEVLVPIPRNRVRVSDGNRRFENYYGKPVQRDTRGTKRKHDGIGNSETGRRALEMFNSIKDKHNKRR